jgi:serine/threonine protein kinase
VCLVLEICEYGSLSDVLRGGDGTAGQGRSPLNLSYSDRMFLALGCARGLQALHSYSPLLCHRDIKSMNFLSESRRSRIVVHLWTGINEVLRVFFAPVDSQLNAKIADLDLGHQYEEDPNAVVPRGMRQ